MKSINANEDAAARKRGVQQSHEYFEKLYAVFQNITPKEVLERLDADCTSVLAASIRVRRCMAGGKRRGETLGKNADKLLFAAAKLSMMLDMFMQSFDADYVDTINKVAKMKQNALNSLAKSVDNTANADTAEV
ncbi:MAG: hypothetical protein ACTTKL_11175 [Treponema sp.]